MLTGDAYSSGHLVPSHLRLAYILLVEINLFPELVVIFPDYAFRISLGTFSILLIFIRHSYRKENTYQRLSKIQLKPKQMPKEDEAKGMVFKIPQINYFN